MKYLFIIVVSIIALTACKKSMAVDSVKYNSEVPPTVVRHDDSYAGGVETRPKAIIYKTRHNYDNNVPVIMNSTRTDIVSYPAPSDLYLNGVLATPVSLANGFLLDRRGISADVAFTDFTYAQYSALPQAPSKETLMEHIIDRYPLTTMYITLLFAGDESNTIKDFNAIVKDNFKGCERISIDTH